jgi:hypothetical protein
VPGPKNITKAATLAELDHEGMIRCAAVSDPPKLTAADIARIDCESRRLGDVFRARTKSMEILTPADLGTCIR